MTCGPLSENSPICEPIVRLLAEGLWVDRRRAIEPRGGIGTEQHVDCGTLNGGDDDRYAQREALGAKRIAEIAQHRQQPDREKYHQYPFGDLARPHRDEIPDDQVDDHADGERADNEARSKAHRRKLGHAREFLRYVVPREQEIQYAEYQRPQKQTVEKYDGNGFDHL